MAILDLLSGFKGLENQYEEAQDLAREKYDPSQLDPVLDYFTEQAREGISPEEEAARRTQTIRSLFGQQTRTPSGLTGGRELAASQAQSLARSGGLSQFETQMSIEDIRAQERGERGLAQMQVQANQIENQREAALEEAELQFESEKDRRRQQALGTVANIVGSVATTPFGPAMQSLAGRGLTELFGGEGFKDLSKDNKNSEGEAVGDAPTKTQVMANTDTFNRMFTLDGVDQGLLGLSPERQEYADMLPGGGRATSGPMDFSFLQGQTEAPRASEAVQGAQQSQAGSSQAEQAGQDNFIMQAFQGQPGTSMFDPQTFYSAPDTEFSQYSSPMSEQQAQETTQFLQNTAQKTPQTFEEFQEMKNREQMNRVFESSMGLDDAVPPILRSMGQSAQAVSGFMMTPFEMLYDQIQRAAEKNRQRRLEEYRSNY